MTLGNAVLCRGCRTAAPRGCSEPAAEERASEVGKAGAQSVLGTSGGFCACGDLGPRASRRPRATVGARRGRRPSCSSSALGHPRGPLTAPPARAAGPSCSEPARRERLAHALPAQPGWYRAQAAASADPGSCLHKRRLASPGRRVLGRVWELGPRSQPLAARRRTLPGHAGW